MRKQRRSAAVVLAVLALMAPACSSGSNSAHDTGTKDSAATSTTLTRPDGPAADVSELTGGKGLFLAAANLLDPNAPKDTDYTESEYAVAGKAVSYKTTNGLPTDGTYALEPDTSAEYKTRIVVRRPSDPAKFNGTVLVEWLNVSGGLDAAPDYTYLHDEIVRQGYAWVGVSAQRIGINGGTVAVGIPLAEKFGAGKGIATLDPERYGTLNIPGDAYSYDIFTQVGRALRSPGKVDALGGLDAKHLIAVGESQSAFTLTTYANGVQPLTHEFDGFFIHSRGGAPAPLGTADSGIDIAGSLSGKPTKIRTDLKVPVMMFETETDVAGILAYAPARQADSTNVRTWEIAGTAHVDMYQLGAVAASFGCSKPINDGPQHFVLAAGLRVLNAWVSEGKAAPASPPPLEVSDDGKGYVLDANGNAKGGVRTPPVDVPVDVLSGLPSPGGSPACFLAGQTTPLTAEQIAKLYPNRAAYLERYTAATDAAIKAGYVLPEDREAMIAFAHPDRVPE